MGDRRMPPPRGAQQPGRGAGSPSGGDENIVFALILSIITCGIYDLFWNYKQMQTLNEFLGREEYNFWMWFFLSILTCGIFHIYYEYKMAEGIIEIENGLGIQANPQLALISIILTIFGMSLVVDAIQQHEINRMFDKVG